MTCKSKIIVLYMIFISIIYNPLPVHGESSQSNPLKVGIEHNFAPYEWVEEELVFGFNVDLITLIADKLNRPVEFYSFSWTSVLEGVKNGTLDIFFGQELFNHPDFAFSQPYLNIKANIVAHQDTPDISSFNDLSNHTVAVGINYPTYFYLEEHAPGSISVPVDNVHQGIELVANREVFAFFSATHAIMYYIQENDVSQLRIIGEDVDIGNMHIGVAKDNTQLLSILNSSLNDLEVSGELSQLCDQWFGKELPERINFVIPSWLIPAFIGLGLISPVLIWRVYQLTQARNKVKIALDKIKTLKGLTPICSKCKNIRDDSGYWEKIEIYVRDHSEAEFSHGICPDCMKSLYGDYI